jgi:Flp pilus assembly protein CpaB
MSNTFSTKVSGRVSSRGWAIALGLGAIVLATILLIVYLDRYRARVSGASAPTPVLVAKQTIPAGTPGFIVTGQKMYTATTLPKKEVLDGAIADPTFLQGRAAAVEVLPGRQLTALDFAASTTTTVDSQITGSERAMSVGIDTIHGSLPQLKAGDDIDIYIGIPEPRTVDGKKQEVPIIKLFRPNIRVLAVPTIEGGNIVLRLQTRDAAKFAWAADNARLWFVLRPAGPEKSIKPTPNKIADKSNVTKPLGNPQP